MPIDVEFFDSFDGYVTADIATKWNIRVGTANSISSGNGRRGTASWRINALSLIQHITKSLAAKATRAIGFNYRIATIGSSSMEVASFLDGGAKQVELRLLTDGTLRVTRNGTTLATSINALSIGTDYFIEFKATIDPSAGVIEVRVNGTSSGWISATGQNTRNTSNSSANQVRLGDPLGTSANVGVIDYDDFYCADDFLGDVRADCYAPNANGNSSQFIGSDSNSTDNYLLVDDSAPNANTDYVESSTSGHKDTYGFAGMSHTPTTIFATQFVATAQKTDAGARSITPVTRSGGSDTDGTTQAVGTSYTTYRQVRTTDPNTGVEWTKAGRDAAEFGYKVA